MLRRTLAPDAQPEMAKRFLPAGANAAWRGSFSTSFAEIIMGKVTRLPLTDDIKTAFDSPGAAVRSVSSPHHTDASEDKPLDAEATPEGDTGCCRRPMIRRVEGVRCTGQP